MTETEYQNLRNRSIFSTDYIGRKLLTDPVIRDKTKASIANLMDDVIDRVKALGGGVVMHCMYQPCGHTSKSQHYVGLAADFHITGIGSYIEQVRAVENILRDLGVSHAVGFGIYPRSHSGVLHLDTRGTMARWAGVFSYRADGSYSTEYVAYSDGIAMISKPGYKA